MPDDVPKSDRYDAPLKAYTLTRYYVGHLSQASEWQTDFYAVALFVQQLVGLLQFGLVARGEADLARELPGEFADLVRAMARDDTHAMQAIFERLERLKHGG